MVEKDKKSNVKVKRAKTQPVVKPAVTKEEEPEVQILEPKRAAIEIAQILNISSFDFFRMKQDLGITDGSFLTISEFKNKYNQIIKR